MATESQATAKQDLLVAHATITQMQWAISETFSRVKSATTVSRGGPGPGTQCVQEAGNIAVLEAVLAFNFARVGSEIEQAMSEHERLRRERHPACLQLPDSLFVHLMR